MVDLVLLDGSGRFYTIPKGGELRVGTGAQCSVRLTADDVSRVHALVAEHLGRVVVLDLGSKNGTYVNGRRVREAEVGVGDVVRFSSVPAQIMRSGEWSAEILKEDRSGEVPASDALTDEAVPMDLSAALNELLGRWRRRESFTSGSLALWLVNYRGMRGAAILEPVGEDVTVRVSYGDLGGLLREARCLEALPRHLVSGSGVETCQLATGKGRLLAVSAKGLPWLVVVPGSLTPDACEVELWVNLLALAVRLEASASNLRKVTGG